MERLRPRGVAELGERLRRDLPDSLPSEVKLPTDLIQGTGVAVQKPEPELDDPLLSRGQGVKNGFQLLFEHGEARGLLRCHGIIVPDEIPEVGVFRLPEGGLQRERVRYGKDLSHPLGGHPQLCADLLGQRGSRPRSCVRSRRARPSLWMSPDTFTGMRMVRDCSAMALVMAWRIHHVA